MTAGLPSRPRIWRFWNQKAMTYLAEGDLAGARAVLKAAPKEVDPTALVALMANFADLAWVLDEAQRDLLLRLTPSAFDDDRGIWAHCLAQASALKRDEPNVRKYAEIARAEFEKQLEAVPEDAQDARRPRPLARVPGKEGRSDSRGRAGGVAAAHFQGCALRPLRPAPARARLHPHGRKRESARHAGAVAEGPIPPNDRRGSRSTPTSTRCGRTRDSSV